EREEQQGDRGCDPPVAAEDGRGAEIALVCSPCASGDGRDSAVSAELDLSFVMAGLVRLVPAIHVLSSHKGVDARHHRRSDAVLRTAMAGHHGADPGHALCAHAALTSPATSQIRHGSSACRRTACPLRRGPAITLALTAARSARDGRAIAPKSGTAATTHYGVAKIGCPTSRSAEEVILASAVAVSEQELRPGLEGSRTGHGEAERVGQPVHRIEGEGDAQRVLDLLGRNARSKDRTHVVGADRPFARQFPQHAQGRSQGLADGRRLKVGEHGCDFRLVAIGSRRHGSVRLDTEFARVHVRHERGHQLAVGDRPRGRSAHGLVGESLHGCPEEIGAIAHQLDGFGCRLARHPANEREQSLCAEAVPSIQDRETHAHSFPTARSRAARAESYWRVDWPTAAHTTISKIWSSVSPDARAAAMSRSVTALACAATFWTNVLNGSVSPAFSNAARRWLRDAVPPPSSIRSISALRSCLLSVIALPSPKLRRSGQTTREAGPNLRSYRRSRASRRGDRHSGRDADARARRAWRHSLPR